MKLTLRREIGRRLGREKKDEQERERKRLELSKKQKKRKTKRERDCVRQNEKRQIESKMKTWAI